jgi:hypothetical protein
VGLATVVGHSQGLAGMDVEICGFESPSRMSDEDFVAIDKRREQHSQKLGEGSVAFAHTHIRA